MREKNTIEKNAARRQSELLSQALTSAESFDRYWLNAAAKNAPKLYPAGVAISPFNALMMALHSDQNGCKSNLYILYSDAKARGAAVREHEKGVPFIFYNWNRYVDKNNPNNKISRESYLDLPAKERAKYKGVHNREIRTLFNLDQTLLPYSEKGEYEIQMLREGAKAINGNYQSIDKESVIRFNNFLLKMRDNMVNFKNDATGLAHYDSRKDTIYLPKHKNYEHFNDYMQDVLRQVVSATGHQQRLAREGMVMHGGTVPSQDAIKYEMLVTEVAAGLKMLEYGLPSRLSDEGQKLAEYWKRELKENPCLIDALESDVNSAIEVMRRAEKGEKIEYATYRTHRQTEQIKEQLPKHYFVADELRSKPDGEKKNIVIVRDPKAKSADVVLPSGASLKVKNEVPGMSKYRIEKALRKEGMESVRFFNPDGALGYRPDDSYFAGKEVSLERLRNWALLPLATLDVSDAVRKVNEVQFERVQMLQDDKNRWALYLRPESQDSYCIYPEKEDLNRYFTTLKQSLGNMGEVRDEIARKYHAMAQSRPELKVDMFSGNCNEIDLNKIERVSVFKTQKEGILCAATIGGEKQAPRSVTPTQWQRMWLANDKDEYKKQIAATVFADVLGLASAREQSDAQATPVQEEKPLSKDEIWDKRMAQWDELKAKHPNAILMFNVGDSYQMYRQDSVRVAEKFGLSLTSHNDTQMVSFPQNDIKIYFPKMIKAGERLVIVDDIHNDRVQKQETSNEEQSIGMRR